MLKHTGSTRFIFQINRQHTVPFSDLQAAHGSFFKSTGSTRFLFQINRQHTVPFSDQQAAHGSFFRSTCLVDYLLDRFFALHPLGLSLPNRSCRLLPKRKWMHPPDEELPHFLLHRDHPRSNFSAHAEEQPRKLLLPKPKYHFVIPPGQSAAALTPDLLSGDSSGPPLASSSLVSPFRSAPLFKMIRHHRSAAPSTTQQQEASKMSVLQSEWAKIITFLGPFSRVYLNTVASKHRAVHIQSIIKKFSPLSLKRHFQVWLAFCEWCSPFGLHPAQVQPSVFLDFAYEASIKKDKGSINPLILIKSLRFIAKYAEIDPLKEFLWSPSISAFFASERRPRNPREVFPLPFHFEVGLERIVMSHACPPSTILQAGNFLFLFWSGMRFQDLQRTPLNSFSLEQGVIRCFSELTKAGHPSAAAALACGLLSSASSTSWGTVWFQTLLEWRHCAKSRTFEPDFLFPDYLGPGPISDTILLRPMPFYKAAVLLRQLGTHSLMCPAYSGPELHTITVHSCKSSLIHAGRSLDLPEHWIIEQGHHANVSQTKRYARDDTLSQLRLQVRIASEIRKGWRPMVPMARGGKSPVDAKAFGTAPPDIDWPPFLWSPCEPSSNPEGVAADVSESESGPSSVSDTSRSPRTRSVPTTPQAWEDKEGDPFNDPSNPNEFILNPRSKIAHVSIFNGDAWRPACGLKLGCQEKSLATSIPSDFELCLRRGCS